MQCGVQLAHQYQNSQLFSPNVSVGKGFKHQEQARYALWPINPETFRLAGMSHYAHIRAARTSTGAQKRTA